MSAYDLALVDALRPRTRGDCERGPRPCPWLACRYHLAVERVPPRRSYQPPASALDEAAADLDLHAMPETCALDVAELGEHTLDEVADLVGRSSERVRQIEEAAVVLRFFDRGGGGGLPRRDLPFFLRVIAQLPG